MIRIFTLLLMTVFALFNAAFSQESFEEQARKIGENIQEITKEEKALLKEKIEALDDDYNQGKIGKPAMDSIKQVLATKSALEIERRIGEQETKLLDLVKLTSDAEIRKEIDSDSKKGRYVVTFKINKDNDDCKTPNNCPERGEKRTTSQFVLAFGLNNVINEGDFSTLENSDFSTWGSRFYEWGITYKTRILKEHNLLQAKYGFSVMYNNLNPTQNRFFVQDGNQTILETADVDLRRSRLRNVYLVLPLHLEFDFTKSKTNSEGKKIFYTQRAPRIGIGGYGGLRLKSKQKTAYSLDDVNYYNKVLGDFNATNFIYGLSTYVGYRNTSLYFKYDLNNLFQNNVVAQNNISFGVRFDFD